MSGRILPDKATIHEPDWCFSPNRFPPTGPGQQGGQHDCEREERERHRREREKQGGGQQGGGQPRWTIRLVLFKRQSDGR